MAKILSWAFTVITVALAIYFTVLKICGLVDWSWWWVLSPVLIPFGIAVLIVLGATFILNRSDNGHY